jgi:enamidase (EC 3.5.2.18)
MAEAAAGGKSGKVVIQNIGLLLSGDLDRPSSTPTPSW